MNCGSDKRFPDSVILILFGLFAVDQSALASGKFEASVDFFNRDKVAEIAIDIRGTNLNRLQQNGRGYVRATVREGETVYKDVAIHLKGAAGSFRGLESMPALTLNFDKFNDGQKFHGLDKIHLNNSVQDASYMTEIICGEMFRAAGVPATRGTHARVSLNGRDLGLYVLKEGFDKAFLHQFFVNTRGNLYDGGFLREITEPLQRTSGRDVKDYSDLKALAAAVSEPDPSRRMARLAQALDLDRFFSFMALEIMTWHWDGYSMKRNNYRLFHDLSTGRMVFFPHGMDQMFWDPNKPLIPDDVTGLVAVQVINTPEGKRRYLDRVAMLYTNVFKVEILTNRINQLQRRIRPVLASINPVAANNHDRAVDNLRNQITSRARFLQRALNTPAAMPVNFGSSNVAAIRNWRVQNPRAVALVDTVAEPGKLLLHINSLADTNCTASWRSHVQLSPGEYHFQGLARTTGVVALKDKKGEGAGVRISGAQKPGAHGLTGDSPWTPIAFDFSVAPGSQGEVDLLCELRASHGEAWFDVDSLKLSRK